MPSLPIPLFSSFVLLFLLVRLWVSDKRAGALGALLALCALQGVIISLAQHYGVASLRVVQPVTAALIPPLAWLAFQSLAVRGLRETDLLHLAAPVCVALAVWMSPAGLDLLIPTVFAAYGAAMLLVSARGADAFPRASIGSGEMPVRIWQIIGAALIASAVSDVLIVATQIAGASWLQPWIISVFSSGMLLIVGGLSLSQARENDAPTDVTEAADKTEEDVSVVARLDTLMRNERLYLDPDLTLTRLARRLHVPVKQLSSAINRVTGENVSRYINAARIEAAQRALLAGENVTSAMLQSGFNTKSNFNREFKRVSGSNPTDWLAAQKG